MKKKTVLILVHLIIVLMLAVSGWWVGERLNWGRPIDAKCPANFISYQELALEEFKMQLMLYGYDVIGPQFYVSSEGVHSNLKATKSEGTFTFTYYEGLNNFTAITNFKLKSDLMQARAYTKTDMPDFPSLKPILNPDSESLEMRYDNGAYFRMMRSGNVIVFATSTDGTITEVAKVFKALGY